MEDRCWLTPSAKQLERFEIQLRRYSLETLEREIALSALQATQVGAMHPDEIGERLLAQTTLEAMRAQVQADGPL